MQSTFTIAGSGINPPSASVRMARGKTVDIPVTISNYGGGQLTGLTFNVQSSSGITTTLINSAGSSFSGLTGESSILTAGDGGIRAGLDSLLSNQFSDRLMTIWQENLDCII